jgi:1-acyl-sn-glycerol-3-phosphate acyltransferase
MKRAVLQSAIFMILFYVLTICLCVLYLPLLVLPRAAFLSCVRFYLAAVYFLEKHILNLTYEVRGQHHLPASGSYIVAAKHQSQYETFKLHALFGDPAIVLKKELTMIPLFGRYLTKTDVIAIDRSTPEIAIQSIQNGARRVMSQGRPIIIFPQGTRVSPETTSEQKPYKVGVARIQEATHLPIIPMAMNAGMFWPRAGWLKSSGCVTFEFLPPIPHGLERAKLLKTLETQIEEKSQELMRQALHMNNKSEQKELA